MPERHKTVVANATPIIALALIGQLDLLKRIYARVLIPPTVQSEVLKGGATNIGVTELQMSDWIKVTALSDARRADSLSDLDRGEAEVIALAQEVNADLVIIDERLARWHAKHVGLKITGTIGVLLEAKRLGLVASLKPLIEQLLQGGIRLGNDVVTKALRLADE